MKSQINIFSYGIISIVIILVALWLLSKYQIWIFEKNDFSFFGPIALGFVSLVTLGATLFRYLEADKKSEFSTYETIIRHFAKNNIELAALKKNFGDGFDLKSEFDKYLNESLNAKKLADVINSKFGDNIGKSLIVTEVENDFKVLNDRLLGEISRLTKSANLNLVFGTLMTVVPVAILGFEVYKTNLNFKDSTALLSHFIPRISIVVFIEIFAFFFLKIYRTNLIDIKYFHNEKTNVQYRYIALKTAISMELPNVTEKIILEMSAIERNFVLKKGETTLEIEKEKLEVQSSKNIVDALKDIIKK